MLEFWKDISGNIFIEIIYNGRGLTEYMEGCGGGDLCAWGDFLRATRDVRVGLEQFWKECYGRK